MLRRAHLTIRCYKQKHDTCDDICFFDVNEILGLKLKSLCVFLQSGLSVPQVILRFNSSLLQILLYIYLINVCVSNGNMNLIYPVNIITPVWRYVSFPNYFLTVSFGLLDKTKSFYLTSVTSLLTTHRKYSAPAWLRILIVRLCTVWHSFHTHLQSGANFSLCLTMLNVSTTTLWGHDQLRNNQSQSCWQLTQVS